jgi:hypothetical protein
MEDPKVGERWGHFRRKTELVEQNIRRFLVQLAQFDEAYEARKERQAQNNPWIFGWVMEN